jgi:formylglycine-generating enzyme required for sulfatase activity
MEVEMKKIVLFVAFLGTLFLCLPLSAIDGSPVFSFDAVEPEIQIINEGASILGKLDPGCRLAPNAEITIVDESILITWSPVPNAAFYKVYSSALPDDGFSVDTSGTFSQNTWTAPLTGDCRFYYMVFETNELIHVPGGTFMMGDTRGAGSQNELPVHSVTLNSFYMSEYQVTQAEYSHYMQPPSIWTIQFGLGDGYPAYFVSWYAALKYCNLRSMDEGLTPVYSISGFTNPADWGDVPNASNAEWNAAICNLNANGYRLPTEAEWEYAARGGTNNPDYLYSGSDEIDAVAWYDNIGNYGSKPVGEKAPNGLGIYDMSGNIYEWCWDAWSSYSGGHSDNPTGPVTGLYRVFRGGYWASSASNCRVAYRNSFAPFYAYNPYGFRVCRSAL